MKKNLKSNAINLREKAEVILGLKQKKTGVHLSEIDTFRLIHELEVHQIELEMQNDELQVAKEQAEIASQKYSELYDLAPSGFFTLSQRGEIIESNISGKQMLGLESTGLKKQSFGFFVSNDSKPTFSLFIQKIFTDKTKECCEIAMSGNENLPQYVYLTGIIDGSGEQCLVTMVDISRLKYAEEALKVSEVQNRNIILQTAMDGFLLGDMQGYLLEVNEIYCRMSGYSRDELLGMRIFDLVTGEDPVVTKSRIQKIIKQGEDRFKSRHRRKNGTFFDVEVSVQFQRSGEGRLVNFVHDITERKQADENLRESEARYKSLFQNNYSVMLLVDPSTGQIKDANPAACQFYGWSHAELCSKNASDINVISREDIIGKMQQAKDEVCNHFYVRHVLASGEVKDVEIYSGPIKFKDTTLLYSIIHDDTEKHKSREALKENERLLRESQAVAHIGSYSADMITRSWNASDEIYNIFGVDETYPHNLDGWIQLIHPDSRAVLTDYFQQVTIEKKILDHECKIIRFNDGQVRWILGLGEIEYDAELNPVRVIGTIQDITKRKIAEEALNQLYNELEDRVKDRTAELLLSNAIIRQAEVKFRTVADFAYNWEFWTDPNDLMLYCSPSCERITGYKASEFVQYPSLFLEIIHPDDLEEYMEHKHKECLLQDAKLETQYRIIRFDGSIAWISHVCQPVFDESGVYIGSRGSNKDVSYRKEMEQLLETNSQKYKLLSENTSDGIFICKKGRFEYVNKAMNRIFGYSDLEMQGLKMTTLIMPDYQEELRRYLSFNTATNLSQNIEVEFKKKDLSVGFAEILLNYISDEKAIYGVIHDITEKKLIQKNLVKAIIRTEEKERTYFSKELHDGLGPLLSTIKLYLQWSERPNSNKSREEIISKAEDILEEALATVKEISNKLSPHLLTNYGLTSAIQSFVDKLDETSAIKIKFVSNASRRLDIEIEASLYRAIIECINNTLKYARAENIYISLNESARELHLQYKDDGAGFDIIETLSLHKGLGLLNLQNRIQTIGGKITMVSKPGKGVDYQIIVNA